jgi:hypothetical protein
VIWLFLRLTWKTPSSLNSFLLPLLLGCIFHVNFPLIQIQYPPTHYQKHISPKSVLNIPFSYLRPQPLFLIDSQLARL